MNKCKNKSVLSPLVLRH